MEYFDYYLMHAQGADNFKFFKSCKAYETAFALKVDYDDPAVESRKCYEVCRKYGKPVIVMEPVKGGNLVNLPESAQTIFDGLGQNSPASYAIRFAAGFEGIDMVLSGMSSYEQMADNISYMKEFQPLNDNEMAAVRKVQEIFKGMNLIPCTA